MSKINKTYPYLVYLFIAGVILFGAIQVFASLGDSDKEQALITEESLRAQFQGMEERLLREGSYIYPHHQKFGVGVGYLSDFDDGFGGGELSNSILIQGIAFLSPSNPSSNFANGIGIFDRQRSGIVTHEVQPGDTPSYIAASFGISTNTLLWANTLNYWSIIKPGQKLVILPTSGVLHEVKKGETLDKIVKKYKGDLEETIAYNGLPADASIEIDQKIIIPNGKKAIYYQPRVRYAYQPSKYIGLYGSKSHRFPWGQCTWYIAQKRYIPWGGHAKYWLGNAQSYGFQTGTEPVTGAIVATRETWYGHVAYVEAVSGNYITISEMSLGRGRLNTRILNKNDWRIRGYIY